MLARDGRAPIYCECGVDECRYSKDGYLARMYGYKRMYPDEYARMLPDFDLAPVEEHSCDIEYAQHIDDMLGL